MNLTDIYRAFHPKEAKIHILFKCTWNIPKDRPQDRIKTSLNKLQKIEIISSIFFDHKELKLETNFKEKKTPNTQKHGD